MEFEGKLRAAAIMLPAPIRLAVYGLLSNTLGSLTPTEFLPQGELIVARQKGRDIAFPNPIPLINHSHIVFDYVEWLNHKYSLPGFVEVEAGDVVVDCGAYVGGFSMSVAGIAKEVHGFEPAPLNFACLQRNLSAFASARVNNMGLFSKTQTMVLNVSASAVEHSLLRPDDGPPLSQREIPVMTLEDYCRERGLPGLDFVKIEAEGVELEIYDGLGAIKPRKLAIDVSPERDGQSPAATFYEKLTRDGYKVQQRGAVMFARL